MHTPTIIIFGFTGDLARRKLIPALYYLIADKKIHNPLIVGAAQEDTTVEIVLERAKPFISDVNELIWQQLVASVVYQKTNVTIARDFFDLQRFVHSLEKKKKMTGNRLVYIAMAAHFFSQITEYLSESGLCKQKALDDKTWHRIVYEKPFGHDLKSAQVINECIARSFDESQIYRMDHYLTKELVSNITLVRFANCVFQPLWNNRYIDQIQIVLDETIGIEGRGGYYDHYGALRDMVQNHMLQLLALIAMEAPEKLTEDSVRDARCKVLEQISFVDGMLGQYEGYQKEAHVAVDSKTETFALLALKIDNPRWLGVPFYLKTGKYLQKNEVAIHIKFKKTGTFVTHHNSLQSNWLTFTISPEATFSLRLNVKKPGEQNTLLPVDMAFCHSCMFGIRPSQAYEMLIQEVLNGQQTSAVRSDEIEASWRLIDFIKSKKLPLYCSYKRGSEGPNEIAQYEHKWGITWSPK